MMAAHRGQTIGSRGVPSGGPQAGVLKRGHYPQAGAQAGVKRGPLPASRCAETGACDYVLVDRLALL